MNIHSIVKWAIGGAMIGATALILLTSPVRAQGNCGTTAAAEAIVQEFKEIPLVSWMNDKGEVIMVFGNPDTGTVTVFATRPGQDRACIVSSGANMLIGGVPKDKKPGKDGA